MDEKSSLRKLYHEHMGKVSDKWSLYMEEWDRLMSPYRDQPIRLLEIGIQNGGSLEIWGKYFPRAEKIVGCDIDEACRNLKYEDNRIAVVVEDANSDDGESQILQHAASFDVIIDDGSHHSNDVIRSFIRYFPLLTDNGIYLVEDLHTSYWRDYNGGLHNPLSSMAFFKRLADVLNFEHWRNNKPRTSYLDGFTASLGVQLSEFDFARIHSIEFVNSCCIIKKSLPDRNVLGRRIVTGLDEQVTIGAKKLAGTAIQDITMAIPDDTNLDVFELIKSIQVFNEEALQHEQWAQSLQAQIAEFEQQVSKINTEKTMLEEEALKHEQWAQSLQAQIAEFEQQVSKINTERTMLEEEALKQKQRAQSLQTQIGEYDRQSQSLQTQLLERMQQIEILQSQMGEQTQQSEVLREQLTEKEDQLWALQTQLTELKNQFLTFKAQLSEQEKKYDALSAQETRVRTELIGLNEHLNQREQILQDLNNKLLEIYSSTAWKLIQLMWKFRLWLAPKGSWQERTIKKILHIGRKSKKSQDMPNQNTNSSSTTKSERVNILDLENEDSGDQVAYKDIISIPNASDRAEYIEDVDIYLSKEDLPVKLIAFYLPQYHPIPENDMWWGRGFTEWTNVSKATPQFTGHYQPHLPGELGFYDLRVPEVQERQVELAKKYGIYGFCFHYYWFSGKRLLEKPLDQYINNSKIDFPFCLCWANENWTRRWNGRDGEILISQEHSFEYDRLIIHDLVKYFSDPRYIRINNRPLLIVYRDDILQGGKATLDYWRNYSDNNGFGNPYIIVSQTFQYSDPRTFGFDAAVDFPPHHGTGIPEISGGLNFVNNEYNGAVYRYSDFKDVYINRYKIKSYRQFNTVSPGWDNEPRRPGQGTTFTGSTPELYSEWLYSAARFVIDNHSVDERIIFINAWNEWAEGAYLEPDKKYGYAYLKSTADVLYKLGNKPKAYFDGISFDRKYPSSNSISIFYNNIVQSWPWSLQEQKVYNQIDDMSAVQDNLSLTIDNFLSTKVMGIGAKPLVSIIIPVFNHFSDTLNCLKSFRGTHDKSTYEIVVIDDASTDETCEVLSKCKTIKYIRNHENLGFLHSCNKAASQAIGDYIVLLNNDTLVMSGWLDALIETFEINKSAGLVGSKLLYPDGRLQEAGGIIWEDASGMNYGRDDDPGKPQYNYLREVDYCSGASICIPKTIWEEVKGFDPLFSPAYYEDTDLAFRIRSKGYPTLYQPLSQVIHVEGATSGTDISDGVKHHQEINREKFYDRWKEVLTSHGKNDRSELMYRNRYRQKHALVIDVCTPKPDHDSGSIDTYQYLLMLRKIGYEVTFISVVDADLINHYVEDLQKRGIECIYTPYLTTIDEYIKQMGKVFDLVMLFRAPYGGQYIDAVRTYATQAKVVFNTVDLHFLREKRESELAGNGLSLQENVTENGEIEIMKKADATIVVSDYEQNFLTSLGENINSRMIPIPREIPGRTRGFEGRKNIVFIGGYLHKPNVDAVLYFVKDIWPLITEALPDCEFWIVGSNVPKELEELAGEKIKVIGFVADISQVFSECKVSVAPLRYGAGIKGKVITSLSYGVPCVATSIASEGIGLTHEQNVLVGDTPAKFAAAVVILYTDSDIWERVSQNGLAFVSEKYSLENTEKHLVRLVRDLEVAPKITGRIVEGNK